jgi:hypothetical protein
VLFFAVRGIRDESDLKKRRKGGVNERRKDGEMNQVFYMFIVDPTKRKEQKEKSVS